MSDPSKRGTLGFEFEFFPTAIAKWTAENIESYTNTSDWAGSKIDGSETLEELKELYPGNLVVPGEFRERKESYVFRHIIDYLREHDVLTNDIDALMDPKLPEDEALRSQPTPFSANVHKELYHRWSVTGDGSVTLHGTFDPDAQQSPDDYLEAEMRSCGGVELISPAFTDSPESYAEVKRVFTLVRDLYFIHVNRTCGLHVHVAFGKHPIGIVALRKIAGLLFALDPFLAELRPDSHSDNNEYCYSIRKRSNAARGYGLVDAIKGLKNPRPHFLDADKPDYFMLEPKVKAVKWVPIPAAVTVIRECKRVVEVA
ncbi:hypothetical protein PG996_008163 [Apiospora saccharicola]|uniref:Amidoligase enzyme n=1 Tax=Apiospora saccharicola TaxID=335842 RepID=A0ABR1UX48_9PEZI